MQKPDARAGIAWCSPPPGMERVLDVAAEDRLHRPERAAGDRGRRLVHPGERRIVAARADPRLGLHPAVVDLGEALDDVDVAAGVAPAAARRPRPAPARGPAPRRPRGAGRSPGRTGAASAGGPARSRSRASAGRRRAAAGRAWVARYRRWNASTPRRSSTSSGSGPGCGSRSSARSRTTTRSRRGRAVRRRVAERTTDLTDGLARSRTPTSSSSAADSTAELAPLADAPPADPPERRDLGRVAQGQGRDPPRRRGHGGRPRPRPRRQQGRRRSRPAAPALRLVIPVALRPTAEASTIRPWDRTCSSSSSSCSSPS